MRTAFTAATTAQPARRSKAEPRPDSGQVRSDSARAWTHHPHGITADSGRPVSTLSGWVLALCCRARPVVMGGQRQALQPPPLRLCLSLAAVALTSLSAGAAAKCLARLDTHPTEFDVCKRGTHCFLFLAEPPMVLVEGFVGAAAPASADAHPSIRTPFRCADAGMLYGLSGASFDLHGAGGLWPSNSDLCVYAGSPEECTFTAMVAYLPNVKKPGHPAYGMALGTAGMLVQVDKRLDLAVPSIPIFEVRSVLSLAPWCSGASVGEKGRVAHGLWATHLALSMAAMLWISGSSSVPPLCTHLEFPCCCAWNLWYLLVLLFLFWFLSFSGSALSRSAQEGERIRSR